MSDKELVFHESETARLCPKCAARQFQPHFHEGSLVCMVKRCKCSAGGEHLHFICDQCGYERTTPCADKLAEI